MVVDVDRLTELAENVMSQQETEKRYRGICAILDNIKNNIGDIISRCESLIGNIQNLRFYRYLNDIYLPGSRVYLQSIMLCRGVFSGEQYYRRYDELCKCWEYKLCRDLKLNGVDNQDLDIVFKSVCLFFALKNEQKNTEEELSILGAVIGQENVFLDNRQTASTEVGKQTAPAEPSTERAKKYFAKAIEAGFMVKTDIGYKWTFGGNARLAYFLMCVYNPNGVGVTPFKNLENLFGVRGLAMATYQLNNAKKTQKWRVEISKLFLSC